MPENTGLAIPKVFLDSSAIIAGIFRNEGGAGAILYAIELGLVEGYISKQVYEELNQNLLAKGGEATWQKFDQLITKQILNVLDDPSKRLIAEVLKYVPAKDVPIVAAAALVPIDYLVTLDVKDFKVLMKEKSPYKFLVVTPGDFLKTFS